MIELSNSKQAYLGKAPDGRRRFALDASIGALQMRGEGEQWQDIKPQLVKVGTKWLSQGTPYRIEIDEEGGRKIYPDRTDLTKYLNLPTIALFKNLPKRVEGNIVIASAPKFDIRFILRNSGIRFEVLIKEPVAFDRINLDLDSAGLDILKLLAARTGMGIPRPRLIDSTTPFPIERWLDWSYSAGQLELGFDLTGLVFPVLLKNTTLDLSVGESADDCYKAGNYFYLTDTNCFAGDWSATYYDYSSGMRFLSVTIPQGATIDNGTVLKLVANGLYTEIPATIIEGQAADTTLTFSTAADYDGRTRTGANVPWTPAAWVTGTPYNSAEIKSVIQEIISRAGWVSGNSLVLFWRDAAGWGGSQKLIAAASWDHATYDPPAIHIEYTVAGVAAELGAFYQQLSSLGFNAYSAGQVRSG